MSGFSIQEQLKQTAERRRRGNKLRNGDNIDDDVDMKMESNSHHNHRDDDDTDSIASNEDISYKPQINALEKQIKKRQHILSELYNKINQETIHLSKLQSKLSELNDLQKQSNNHPSNNNHHSNQSNNHYTNHNHRHKTPQLIRAEKKRMAKQEQHDREVALQLQRQLDREENAVQQQQIQMMNRNRNREDDDDDDDDDGFNMIMDEIHRNRSRPSNRNRAQDVLNARNPFLLLNGSSPFNSAFGGASFDQSGFNAIHRHRFENIMNRNFERFMVSDGFDDMSYEELNDLFPNIPQGANEDTIQRLPMSCFKRKEDEKENTNNQRDNNDKNKCCICLERFTDGDTIRRLPCLHIFHKKEIDQWLRQNRKCPICRINVEQHQ